VGVGNDWDNAIARTPGAGQNLVHQDFAPVGDTYWVQRQTAATVSSGTPVTINDTAPTGDQYNLSIVEVLVSSNQTPTPDLTIAKNHSGKFVQGQTSANYTITVTNSGGAATSGTVTVTDTLPASLTPTAISGTGWACTLATLTCTRGDTLAAVASYPAITLTVNVASNAPASVTNTATVSGGGETNTTNDTANDITTINTPPDLTIIKSHSGSFVQGQTGATYTITVTNSGGAGTSGTVTVTDTLPASLTPTAISGTGWTCTLATLTCTRGDTLAAAASYPAIALTVNVASNATSSVTNTATVSGGGETNTTNDTANDITTINTPPDLTITKSHSGNFIQGQAGATYAITVTNIGGAATSGTVTVTDTLPASLTATAIAGTGWTCTVSPTLGCTRSDALATASSYPAITLTVNVASSAPASVTNTATVSGGGETNTSNDTANDITTVTAGGGLVHVGGAAAHPVVTNQTMTFSYTAVGTNDALAILVGCLSPGVTSMSLTAPGWTFTPISGLVGPSGHSDFISSFGAITPSTAPATFTVTLTGGNGNCSGDGSVLVDEFSGNDITGGTTTFDAHNESLDNTVSTGICTGAPVTPANNNDAIWYACYDNVTGVGGGYVKGQDDTIGDWSEYKILSGGSGVVQNPSFVTNPNFSSFGLGGVSIKAAASGASIPDLTVSKTHSGSFTQGQTGASYSITVTNSGGAATSGTVTMTDTLPAALTPTAIGGTGWTCTLATLTCTRSDALAAVASYPAITLTVNVASNAPSSVTNTATVSGGGETNTSNDTANDITTVAPTNVTNIKLVQQNFNGNEATGSGMSVSFPSSNTAGNFLIVTGAAARPASTITISDTAGNTYFPAFGPVTDTTQNVTAYIWYVPACKGGPNTVNITPSTGSALEIHVSEWSGVATASPVDQIASATGTGAAASSGSQTTSVNGELVFGYGWVSNTASAGSGFTAISSVNGDLDEYLVQSSASSVAATFTQISGTWFAMMVTFKPASGGTSGYSISGTVSPAANGSGTTIGLSGTSSSTVIADSSGNYSFANLSNGPYMVNPSKTGFAFTPANQSVPVNGANIGSINFTAQAITSPPASLTLDANISKDQSTASTTVTTSAFSTVSGNELLLAFVGADYQPSQSAANVSVTGLSGGGLTWTLARRTNTQSGTAEIWRAFAPAILSSITVTATLSQSVQSSITVLSFSGVDTSGTNGSGAIGAIGSANASSGAPTATLVTTRNNSWVFGVGNDYDNAIARTLGSGQKMVHQDLAPINDTYWVQMQNAATPLSGTSVTINDTAPTQDRYNLSIVEVLPSLSGVAVSTTPVRGGVTVTQPLLLTATVQNDSSNAGVDWSSSGGSLSNQTTSSATFSATAPGVYTITATSKADGTRSAAAVIGVTDLAGVRTWRNDASRSGVNSQEFALTTQNVTASSFGKLFSCPVDGWVFAQPLWVANVPISGAQRNVVFVATENDSLYAFDADGPGCKSIWSTPSVSLIPSGEKIAPLTDLENDSSALGPVAGITGTPVIDPSSQTLYLVALSENSTTNAIIQRLHAIDITTGQERPGSPKVISASVSGTGYDNSSGTITFAAKMQKQRPALLLLNGVIYISWAGFNDTDPYHGWLMGYDASTLAQVTLLNDTRDGGRGGIWMSGGGPAADSQGNVYLLTGNGDFNANSTGGRNYGDTFLKLGTSGGLSVSDWFTPFDQNNLAANDLDLGGGGAVILIDQASGPFPHLVLGGGKAGTLYVVNRDNFGHYNSSNDSQIVQSFTLGNNGIYSAPLFWQNTLYAAGSDAPLSAYSFSSAASQFQTNPVSVSAQSFGFPGTTPALSAVGTNNAILWAIERTSSSIAVLHAYDPRNLKTELWNSSQALNNRDKAGIAVKFTVPTIANGKVYIGTQTELDVFGLLPN
jgi:uncharacterized repeat protein (TIGR01451 family)